MRNNIFFLLLLLFTASCMTKKEIVYLQNPQYKEKVPISHTTRFTAYTLQPNDVLSVKVLSVDPDMANMFNIVNPTNAFGMSDPGSMYLSGYTVDNEGLIHLPTVGKLKVEGLTTSQTQELIQRNLNRYIRDATVVAKLISFKISVLGDVRNPGYYYIYNDRANLFEGLGMAGDLNQGANRKNVKLIRQKGDQSEVVLLDLTDPNLVQSQYYYLMPNDVLYVEPRASQLKRDNLVVVSVILSVVSTGVLLLNFLK
ncbi:polysaccharide export outer membrane protein [Pontibacter ummariensis]|uniref:Polysaccharide export outer membrane protein n=1 Tax=Pontibacter ummariensis TaxID=1610492 RepID=A0A239GFA7_9BACT|nr:polysaccharide biosynthesis/export family protein [Pontibacter ummariensis]PRY11245.1 polysaccharide export outer membrane protein [Pontibacter ummariensis]SNS67986.1 polysaccharide export outer membrane protein [Pontibacter ummariensis]